MAVIPYLQFDGDCADALKFYEAALGASISMLLRVSDAPDPSQAPPGLPPEAVMHAEFTVAGAMIMASDGRPGADGAQSVSVALQTQDPLEAKRWFDGLSAGAEIQTPFAETFFSPGFGVLTDTFGVSWFVMTLEPEDDL
ncbi:MAG: VOC family protein [Pseudomonadota bacterium]